jgi:hypothetical protein
MSDDVKKEESEKKLQIAQVFADLSQKLKRHIKINDLVDAGITKDMVTHHYRSLSRLSEYVREKFPDSFHDVDIQDIMGPKGLQELQGAVQQYKRFIITTAVTSCQVHENLLSSMEHYCRTNNACILVLVASDPAHNREFGKQYGSIDKKIIASPHAFPVISDTALNTNLYISTIKLSAKHIDPLTGLARIGQRNGSFIYASPKQRMKPVPVSNIKLPHMLMTTGAITKPDYSTENYMSERTAHIAEHDHMMGAIIVEVVDKDFYHFRQIQGDKAGSFIDLGIQYNSDGTTENVAPSAFVLGDWHTKETDPVARSCWEDIMRVLKPQILVLHDAFSGVSINHHEEHRSILKAQRAAANELDLSSELRALATDLNDLSELVDEVVVVKSNHDEFLERYLQDGKYVSDPQNHRTALILALHALDGGDPLKYGVEMSGLTSGKVRWLKRDEDFKVGRVQLGNHGDLGANGAKGSLRAMEAAYGNSVSGHSHSPEILRGAYQVGTSSYLKLSYNRGPSSWMHTSCLVYPNGSRQLINCINGNWRMAA